MLEQCSWGLRCSRTRCRHEDGREERRLGTVRTPLEVIVFQEINARYSSKNDLSKMKMDLLLEQQVLEQDRTEIDVASKMATP